MSDSINRSRDLLIWGASGHALVVADAVRCGGRLNIAGFIDDVNPGRAGESFGGSRIIGGRDVIKDLQSSGVVWAFAAVGDNAARVELGQVLRDAGFRLPVIVHPRAIVADAIVLGDGTYVAAGCVICPEAHIGRSVIVNTAATVDHHCLIGEGAHVAPGAHLAGWVSVGEQALIGVGASVRDRIRIGARAVIGAGAAVVTDIPAGTTACGVPARVREDQ